MPQGEDPDSLIRREGKETFEKRVAAARDFFDYWIEREAAGVDLASLSAKMQLAKRLAETVSRVRDPFMRGEISSKVSARLGVAAQEFQSLLPRQRSNSIRSGDQTETNGTHQNAPVLRHDIAMLCLLALRDDTSRRFILEQNWRDVLEQTPCSDLLIRILESEIRPDDAASLNVFMSRLSVEDER